jgi:hypothetical protein
VSVRQVDTVEEQAENGNGKKRFYNDPAILGTLITISVLIIIVLLLLVACRVKRVSLKMPKGEIHVKQYIFLVFTHS